ncbi:EAL domain-containing protein [Evansella sp. AB-rgal1]|uniref:sensor domain-containing protein n=1 Tax=Evansella sp. AB-rgal1 TaxID=3242696 RepID=UPI00359D54E4
MSPLNIIYGLINQLNTNLEKEYGNISPILEEILNQLKELHTAFDQACILGVTDSNGTIIEVNETFCEISGYTREELIGKTYSLIKSGYHSKKFYQEMWKTIKSGNTWVGEVKNRKKNGDFYWVQTTIYPILNSMGIPEKFISIRSDITEGKEYEEQLRKLMAYKDIITGLPNRLLLEEELTNTLANTHSDNEKVALVIVNIDQFKNIIDTLGYSVGDYIVKKVAARLESFAIKQSDKVSWRLYQIGIDEFVFVLDRLQKEDISVEISKIMKVFQEPFYYNKMESFIQVSIGSAIYPNTARDSEELMKHADMALNAAKSSGSGTNCVFAKEMKEAFLKKIEIETELRKSIMVGTHFQLFYQPIIQVNVNKIVYLEALVRWFHPIKGIVSPMDFIQIAEDSGLIIPLGEIIIHQACKDLRYLEGQLGKEIKISINISSKQLKQNDIVMKITKIVSDYNVKPSSIQFEITENGLMDITRGSVNKINQLRQIGFSIAIDDYGSGFSSLTYLKNFPVDCLKIDKSFIVDILNNRADKAIVSSTVKLGEELGVFVTAEGVETKETYEYLKSIGCNNVQGYYFSKPVSVDQIKSITKNLS